MSAIGQPTHPSLPSAGMLLARSNLEARLDEALSRPLTVMVAGPGYGKTTLLASWSKNIERVWYNATPTDAAFRSLTSSIGHALGSPSQSQRLRDATSVAAANELDRANSVATHFAAQLERSLQRDLALIVDDAHALSDSPSARLIENLIHQAPARLHIILASRERLPFRMERLHRRGQILELSASDLAFTPAEVSELIELMLGADSAPLARQLYEVTEGWPAAVRLALEALEHTNEPARAEILDRLRRPEGPLFAYLAQEVLVQQPAAVQEVIRTLALLDHFTPELCESLGIADCRRAIGALTRQGIFLTPREGEPASFSLHALVREYAAAQLAIDVQQQQQLQARAAAWYEQQGIHDAALNAHRRSGQMAALARFLTDHGERLLTDGSIEAVVEAGVSLPPELRSERLDEVLGEAHSLKGQWDEALTCYERAAAGRQEIPPGLAWRMGRLYWDRGEIELAARTWERGRVDGTSLEEEALLLAWLASPYRSAGKLEEARRVATEALAKAQLVGSPRALAAAHNAVGHIHLGRDNGLFEHHLDAAVEAARAARDVLQVIRFTINRCGPAQPSEAIPLLSEAVELAELAGADLYLARALNARGENYLALGRYTHAMTDLRRALSLWERHGSARRNWALMSLASVARLQGDLASARTAYVEALDITRDAEGLINVHSGLARTLAFEEPAEAQRLAMAAVAEGRRLGYMLGLALLAAGWVALAHGAREEAQSLAEEALAETHRQRLPFEYAEALELDAMASADPLRGIARLDEALGAWRLVGNEAGLARVELAIARLRNDRGAAENAQHRLRALGVRDSAAGAAGLLSFLPAQQPEPVRVRTLGSFHVLRDGQPVSLNEWRSRKARDLLKILIARRGRAAPREYLMEALWPDQDPGPLANRLSVALSLLRTVLDPARRFGPEHYVAGGKSGLTLRLDALPVDIEEFLATAETGFRLLRQGDLDEARHKLLAADDAYAGEFLEEDAYEDWAASLREEARVLYVAVAHALAELAGRSGDHDASARYLLRVLERDPYDERAHLGLVTALAQAGHHGEARRCYAAYTSRMQEIGVEAAAYPAVVPVPPSSVLPS